MTDYVKHTHGKQTIFVVPVKEDEGGATIYLDFTRNARPALNRDRKERHQHERGPNFAMEVAKATEYAQYLGEECNLSRHNLHKFNTKAYSLFVES